ncbi:hypothetical protein [Psychroserpens luteolus]|uniref:hypothetical protein n=1 Tax=Psychroserpens luteolus TaxID=2855840 RepID=UPI001E647D6D|nr:hypothetical protein [Psychroserpens luteolus]MCD2258823.1 hypothetical protein [Psychroserpens luteolus]
MDKIEERIKEIEERNKKSNKINLLVGLVILLGLASFYFYSAHIQAEKNRQIANTKQELEIKALEKKNEELRALIAEQQVDSIQKYAVYSANEVKEQLNEIRKSTTNTQILKSVDSIETRVNTIKKFASDTVAIRYYKRKLDGDVVEKVIRGIESPHYIFDSIINVADRNKVNTIYYGDLVKKQYAEELALRLKNSGINIVNVKPFKSKKGYDWKKITVQIEFESTKVEDAKNNDWQIRLYSYKPDQRIKKRIESLIGKSGFKLTVFPDWEEKMSFFSNRPTVLYYTNNNSKRAEQIAKQLFEATKVKFNTSLGKGYGVSEKDKNNLFIIHYNGDPDSVSKSRMITKQQQPIKTDKY